MATQTAIDHLLLAEASMGKMAAVSAAALLGEFDRPPIPDRSVQEALTRHAIRDRMRFDHRLGLNRKPR